jgi:hypothetical protein
MISESPESGHARLVLCGNVQPERKMTKIQCTFELI